MLESDEEYGCPYCSSANTVRVDVTGGRSQRFVTDCEVCCKPIEIEIEIESDGYVCLTAKREGEG